MKKLIILVCVATLAVAGNYRAVPMEKVEILQSGKAKKFCNVCGMTLPMFYKTNHAAKIDGKTHQYCSIHCMHEDALSKGKKVTSPQVVNNDTLKFIQSKDAFYVVGSKKPATMAMVSKYAFGSENTAKAFADKFGGKVMRFDEVSKNVQTNLQKDMAMIKKRQAKAAKMGEKIYNKMCKATEKRFATPAQAKAYLSQSNICGKIKGKPFQQVGLFLAGKGAK